MDLLASSTKYITYKYRYDTHITNHGSVDRKIEKRFLLDNWVFRQFFLSFFPFLFLFILFFVFLISSNLMCINELERTFDSFVTNRWVWYKSLWTKVESGFYREFIEKMSRLCINLVRIAYFYSAINLIVLFIHGSPLQLH